MSITQQIITNTRQFLLNALAGELKTLSVHVLQIGDRKICSECLAESEVDQPLTHTPDCIAKDEQS